VPDPARCDARGAKAVLDHVAIGTRALTGGWRLFGGLLGGRWAYGGDSPGFWWGQVQFSAGPKIELITPTAGPDAGFLERFLDARGAGPHHLNFIVPDIEETLSRVTALGIEPVRVELQNPRWKEAFLHPRDAHGIVIQVAEQSGPPPELPPPAGFPASGPPSSFDLIEHQVADIESAARLFASVLDGEVGGDSDDVGGPAVELAWRNGGRLRLVPQPGPASRPGDGRRSAGAPGSLRFVRADAPFTPAERGEAAVLSHQLGVRLQLGG
jgi:methylmalonyl-CoA/ethylmalonyl-CoA epimerase